MPRRLLNRRSTAGKRVGVGDCRVGDPGEEVADSRGGRGIGRGRWVVGDQPRPLAVRDRRVEHGDEVTDDDRRAGAAVVDTAEQRPVDEPPDEAAPSARVGEQAVELQRV